jgi:hypothetical protein
MVVTGLAAALGDRGQEGASGNSGRTLRAQHEDRVGHELVADARLAEPQPGGSEVAEAMLQLGVTRSGVHRHVLHPYRSAHKLNDLDLPRPPSGMRGRSPMPGTRQIRAFPGGRGGWL